MSKYQSVKKAYNSFADEYVRRWPETWKGADFIHIKQYLQSLPTGASLLELGCGDGSLVDYCARQGHKATGIDISEQMIQQAKKRNYQGDFIVADFAEFLGKNTSYDAILSRYALQYLTYDDFSMVLNRINASLSPNGSAFLIIHYGAETKSIQYKWPDGSDGGTMHLMSEKELYSALTSSFTHAELQHIILTPVTEQMGDYLCIIHKKS